MSDIQYVDYEPRRYPSGAIGILAQWYENYNPRCILFRNDPILVSIPWYRSPALSANIPIRKIWAAERELKNWTKRLRKEARAITPKSRITQ